MTLTDFNAQFDLYYNNVASNQAPGLNPYEKSVFLTDAEYEYVLNLYNGKNPSGESFEQTEELRRYLSTLVLSASIDPSTTEGLHKLDANNSYFFQLPQDTEDEEPELTLNEDTPTVKTYKKPWFIVYEEVEISGTDKCENKTVLDVYPTRYDEYSKIKKNPFRGANDRRALRFDYSDDMVEIVSEYAVTKYNIRYLRKPKPIILEDLGDDLSIEGENTAMECELPDSLHKAILRRAVELAIQSWNRQ